jgi:hypothetical protein
LECSRSWLLQRNAKSWTVGRNRNSQERLILGVDLIYPTRHLHLGRNPTKQKKKKKKSMKHFSTKQSPVLKHTELENLSQSSLCIRVTTLPGLYLFSERSLEDRFKYLQYLRCSSMVVRFLTEPSNISFQKTWHYIFFLKKMGVLFGFPK